MAWWLIAQKDRNIYMLFIMVSIVCLDVDIDPEEYLNQALTWLAILTVLNLRKPVHYKPRLNARLADLENEDCKSKFRFDLRDLYRLHEVLDLPDFTLVNRAKYVGEEAMLILLFRIHSPGRWDAVQLFFGGSIAKLSEVYNLIIRHIYHRYCI